MTGLIADRMGPTPLWGVAGFLISALIGTIVLGEMYRRLVKKSSAPEIIGMIFTVSEVVTFFIQCAILAWVILNPLS